MRISLGRVLRSFDDQALVSEWQDAVPHITDERTRLEATLAASPGTRIYGFTTLLGHLDSVAVESVGQTELLNAHLIGPTTEAPSPFLRLVALCKAEQLHHGGSGIHPAAYERVLVATTGETPSAPGSWLSSYGAGDVVPAAWWIRSLFGDAAGDTLHQGDLIALLNGTFYSTALATAASISVIDLASQFLARASVLCAFPSASKQRARSALSPALLGAFSSTSSLATGDAQLPVSLRDAGAYLVPVVSVVDSLGTALERRLAFASANPLFSGAAGIATGGASGTTAEGTLTAESQSSFLDPTLTLALTNAIQCVHLIIGAAQRMIVHLCERGQASGDSPDPRFVQPPKVAQALAERGHLIAGQLPSHFSGSESDGVEDLRDLSLLTAQTTLELTAIGTEILGVLDFALALSGRTEAGPTDLLRAELLRTFVDGADVDAHSVFTRFAPLSSPFLH